MLMNGDEFTTSQRLLDTLDKKLPYSSVIV
jgi:hypothetical protein